MYQHLFERAAEGRVVRAGVIGSGQYGTAIVTQAPAIPLLDVPVVAEEDITAARSAFLRAGTPPEDIIVCDSRGAAVDGMEAGKAVVVEDALLLMDLPLDIVVECTGIPKAGARHAHAAIRHGKHIAMVNKETDSVVGPILSHLAAEAGLVYTQVEGDQHGLLMGLVSWARTLGLEVLCGGKARNVEFVYDIAEGHVTGGHTVVSVEAKDRWALQPIPPGRSAEYIEARRALLARLPQPQTADRCEMTIAANGTGLMPDVAGLHRPIVRTVEIPEVLCPRGDGGILETRGAIESITNFRAKDGAGLGGGVFVVIACDNDYSRMIITTKGLIANHRGTAALVYRPHHLCGVETPISLLSAVLLGVPTGTKALKPVVDLIARASVNLKAGTILGDDTNLLSAIVPARPVKEGNPLPFYMLADCRMNQDVPAGATITAEMVEAPNDSVLWALRARQDSHFFA